MRAVGLVIIGEALVGCASDPGEPLDSPEAALDAADAIEAEAMFMYAILVGTETRPRPDAELVASIVANVPRRWQPAGCAQVTQPTSTHLAFTFADCRGPRGLVHVSGTLDLFSEGWSEEPRVDLSSPGISANGSTFAIAGSAAAVVWPGALGVDGALGGRMSVGPRGHELDRGHGRYIMLWDVSTGCGVLHADAAESDPNPDAGQASSSYVGVDVTRCPGRCPSGVVSRHFPNDADLQVTMDGTTLASWTSQGIRTETRHGTVELACE